MGSSRKMRASMSLRLGEMSGSNSIQGRMCSSIVIPGAISVSIRPFSVTSKTQRSVIKRTFCPALLLWAALKVI